MNAAPPERPRRVVLLLAVAAFVIAADVISKAIVVATMPDHPNIRLLGGALTITLTRNGGAAFSIGPSMTIVFTVIALGVVVQTSRSAPSSSRGAPSGSVRSRNLTVTAGSEMIW